MVAKSENGNDTRYIGARLPKDLYERFQRVADSEQRSVSGELRKVIEQRVAEAEKVAA